MEPHVSLYKRAFKIKYSPKKSAPKQSNADSKSDVEILLYGKRPSPASRAGIVRGERAGQDGYVFPRESFAAHTALSQAHCRYL